MIRRKCFFLGGATITETPLLLRVWRLFILRFPRVLTLGGTAITIRAILGCMRVITKKAAKRVMKQAAVRMVKRMTKSVLLLCFPGILIMGATAMTMRTLLLWLAGLITKRVTKRATKRMMTRAAKRMMERTTMRMMKTATRRMMKRATKRMMKTAMKRMTKRVLLL
jgi:hypothetical protein